MAGLISDNYRILLVMSRFGIGLGFGDRSIGEVCRQNGVHTATFLAIANMPAGEQQDKPAADTVSVAEMMTYLQSSHSYFLDYRLPGIRAELVEAVGADDKLARAIVDYFDEYAAEVRQHMKYEEDTVFPYVRGLLAGHPADDYSIEVFRSRHDQVEARLTEFKNILIKYYPARSSNEINAVLFDIFNCEGDLASHNAVEDNLFIPAVLKLENEIHNSR